MYKAMHYVSVRRYCVPLRFATFKEHRAVLGVQNFTSRAQPWRNELRSLESRAFGFIGLRVEGWGFMI